MTARNFKEITCLRFPLYDSDIFSSTKKIHDKISTQAYYDKNSFGAQMGCTVTNNNDNEGGIIG